MERCVNHGPGFPAAALLNDAIGPWHEEGVYVAPLPPGGEGRATVVTQRII